MPQIIHYIHSIISTCILKLKVIRYDNWIEIWMKISLYHNVQCSCFYVQNRYRYGGGIFIFYVGIYLQRYTYVTLNQVWCLMLASIIDKRKYLHDGDVLEARRSRTSQNSPLPSNYVLTCDKTNTIKKYFESNFHKRSE